MPWPPRFRRSSATQDAPETMATHGRHCRTLGNLLLLDILHQTIAAGCAARTQQVIGPDVLSDGDNA
jgi:hypothetical protein